MFLTKLIHKTISQFSRGAGLNTWSKFGYFIPPNSVLYRMVAVKRCLTFPTPCGCCIFTVTVALSGIRWYPTGYDGTGGQRLFKET